MSCLLCIGRFRRFLLGLLRAEVCGQIIQKTFAVGVGNDGAEARHFVEFVGPLRAGEMLVPDAAGIVTLGAGGFHLRLHRSGRKGLAGSLGCLGRGADGCEQNEG